MTDEIIFKYITGQADENEIRNVREWADISEERRLELSRMKNSWVLASLNNEIDPFVKKQQIQLILDKINVLNKKNKSEIVRIKWLRYAASVLLIIGLSASLGYFISNSQHTKMGFTEIIVPKGERSKVVLPDGSTVQLNGGSQLKFMPDFKIDKRIVQLEGEAFFEVTHDKSHPFVVETNNNLQVEVLGTSFNVCSYSDDKIITTYLETGKVKVSIDGGNDIFLNPSEVLKFEKQSGKTIKQTMNDHRFSDWTSGILNIQGETIAELSKKLERRFDIEIEFGDNEVQNHTYTGSIKDEDLNTVLSALEFLSELSCKREGKVVTLSSKK